MRKLVVLMGLAVMASLVLTAGPVSANDFACDGDIPDENLNDKITVDSGDTCTLPAGKHLNGDVEANGKFNVGKDASVNGNIKVEEAQVDVLAGASVNGNIEAKGPGAKITLVGDAYVNGNLKHEGDGVLDIGVAFEGDGAVVDGNVEADGGADVRRIVGSHTVNGNVKCNDSGGNDLTSIAVDGDAEDC